MKGRDFHKVVMETIRTPLRQVRLRGDEVGGAQWAELRSVTSEVDQEDEAEEAGPGTGHYCSQVGVQEEEQHGGLDKAPAESGAGLYLGQLRNQNLLNPDRRFLDSPHVGRVSRASHPPGSSEGTLLASEVLHRFREMHMDHTWTESLYATLQFPHRSLRSSVWLLDSAGLVSEQIPLNPSDYCPYSATGTAMGGVVYANYGRQQDFYWLRSSGVSVVGSVVVIRVGGDVTFAEKVWMAERNGAGGVLIYPDPADLPQDPRRLGLNTHTAVSEHVHLGSGDPFTPGFPSFNHTQFPSIQSSGLPLIPVLPISATVAAKLLSQLTGLSCPPSWRVRLPYVRCVVGPDLSSARKVKMSVNNEMMPVLLNNIFSSLEGQVEPDQYIILGAQRDSLGPGAAKSGVGTAILLELARTFSAMGYLSMLHLKAVAYFSLDQAVMGDDILSAHSSPLLVDLLDAAIRQERAYPFVNTPLDSVARLQEVLGGRLGIAGRSLGELVGEMVLRLAHDHILPLRITSYAQTVLQFSAKLNKHSCRAAGLLASATITNTGYRLSGSSAARGDYGRAAKALQSAIDHSDLYDPATLRSYNTRIMRVEYFFLSQYVSVVDTPFRHVIHGHGEHTLSALSEHLDRLTSDPERFDEKRFRRQLALFTWTLQGAANAMSAHVWNIHTTHTQA
ncbi:hypothetical protein fugu_002039 [Takifugu bimaculatus]|uniref:PA domain-containing protein n=1 Tax=Takifugu bimaculatus TaxID=433685 RepID=A0A4Z2BNI7_9TELE|nr:hypothetical protein fugu_002039 [Takifugu bimaculatus]